MSWNAQALRDPAHLLKRHILEAGGVRQGGVQALGVPHLGRQRLLLLERRPRATVAAAGAGGQAAVLHVQQPLHIRRRQSVAAEGNCQYLAHQISTLWQCLDDDTLHFKGVFRRDIPCC